MVGPSLVLGLFLDITESDVGFRGQVTAPIASYALVLWSLCIQQVGCLLKDLAVIIAIAHFILLVTSL